MDMQQITYATMQSQSRVCILHIHVAYSMSVVDHSVFGFHSLLLRHVLQAVKTCGEISLVEIVTAGIKMRGQIQK